ncbi:MAG: endo alpha-1,4 polygalactosaminidase [Ignavibacteriales bacterium]|nr:endo alpha-1,4 polygalactosaminidase [Ignavibacteriales bacterium]
MKIKLFVILIISIHLFLVTGCKEEDSVSPEDINYRQEMRNFVTEISKYAKSKNPEFNIVPQNGQELATLTGESEDEPILEYLDVIDATGREDLFYGYVEDNVETPEEDKNYLIDLCKIFEENNVKVLAIDYCSTHTKMDNSYKQNEQNGFISFAADNRELNNIPNYPEKPYNENSINITQISQAKNFLYLINSENFSTKQDFISAVTATNYDLLVMDLFHNEIAFTPDEINQLKIKQNGGTRLVICYMSIGEAEDYRFYWKTSWSSDKPDWLDKENPFWEGNYKVKYWNSDWKNIIYGNQNSYLDLILNANFDGVYLDIIDAYEYYEEL